MEIKNCPFCGGKAEVEHTAEVDHAENVIGAHASFVRCKDCGARTETLISSPEYSSDDEVINKWNERADKKARDPENYKKVSYDNLYLFDNLTATDILKERDPDENYIGTKLEVLDAYERQLKRWDIKVGDVDGRAIIEAFAKNDETIKLFPEYLCRCLDCTHKDVLKLYAKSIR